MEGSSAGAALTYPASSGTRADLLTMAAPQRRANFPLDILGQQPLLQIYTQICCCYGLSCNPALSPAAALRRNNGIVETLNRGLDRLYAGFPWTAGRVVNAGAREGHSGVYSIELSDSPPAIFVKGLQQSDGRDDQSSTLPTMEELRAARYPMSLLHEEEIAPRKTLPGPSDAPASEVFLVQATFLPCGKGLVLTFLGHHSAMDMTGQGEVIRLFSKACRNEPFTREELSVGNADRQHTIPLLDASYSPGPELAHQIISRQQQPAPDSSAPGSAPTCSWATFCFTAEALAALKARAEHTLPPSASYVSTDDAVSAFIWQSVTRARLPRTAAPTECTTTFARAVDVRRYLDVEPKYPGLMQNMTYHTYGCAALVQEPLGTVAAALRKAVDPRVSSLGAQTRAFATFLARSADKSASFTATVDSSSDLMLSSWAKVGHLYGLDFNLGVGGPEAVRRPRFLPVESLIYLLPRAPDGAVAAAVCLRDCDLERLRGDEEFTSFGACIE